LKKDRNDALENGILPVDVVFHPSWWHRHYGMNFDEGFFYDPVRRVESERKMEQALYDRFGDLGLGEDRDKDLPVIGAVHNAAGYLVSEMLGCKVDYVADAPPQVNPAHRETLEVDVEAAFAGPAFGRLAALVDALKDQFGYVVGDVNWGGVLNIALDLRGQELFLDMLDRPEDVRTYFGRIAAVIDLFVDYIQERTGSSSISGNRNVRHLKGPVFMHSECTLTMISTDHYDEFILPIDKAWSARRRPFGVHYCGEDPHRYAEAFAKIPHLDFLDVGWGGDLRVLREKLPKTFLNIRLSPVLIVDQSVADIRHAIRTRVADSSDPRLTGVCCINMDDRVADDKVRAIFETVFELRKECEARL
jgi:hypothetical protein